MGKLANQSSRRGAPVKELSKETMRKRRRASQGKHRHQVAACYERLKISVPGVSERMKDKKVKSLSKPDLLERSKQYIVHLENVLKNLLQKVPTTSAGLPSSNIKEASDNPILKTIMNFRNIDEFRKHFAQQFDTGADVMSYFKSANSGDESMREPGSNINADTNILNLSHVVATPSLSNTRQWSAESSSQSSTKSKGSSRHSDDCGFFSGETGSQEKNFEPRNSQCSFKATPKHSVGFQTFGSPFRLQPTMFGAYPNDGFFDHSQFYFYVPAVGYPAPFYLTYNEHLQPLLSGDFSPLHSASLGGIPGRNVGEGFSDSVIHGSKPKSGFPIDARLTPSGGNCTTRQSLAPTDISNPSHNCIKMNPLETGADAAIERLTVQYEYNEPDGSLSPPKICFKGLSE